MTSQPHVLVLITSDEFNPALRGFLDTLKDDHTTTVTHIAFPGINVKGFSWGHVIDVDQFFDANVNSQQSFDALCILQELPSHSGGRDTTDLIQQLCSKSDMIIASGSARETVARTGLLDERTVSARGISNDVVSRFPKVRWSDDGLIRDAHIWTADGSPKCLRDLGLLLPHANDLPRQLPAPSSPAGAPTISENGKSREATPPGERLARFISSSSPSKAYQVVLDAVHFAIRLGVEGFMQDCNDIISALLRAFPNSPELLLGQINAQRPLEFLWEAAGSRPESVPWDPPSAEQLNEWDIAKKDSHKLPQSAEYRGQLESLAARIRYGDAYVRPYTLVGAVVMAVESGDDALAREWMETVVRQEYQSEDIQFQYTLAEWRALGSFFKTGFVARTAGRTAEQARADAEAVRGALMDFHKTSSAVAEQRRTAEEAISKSSWQTIVLMLETVKWEEHEVLRRLPATAGMICEVEEKLGVQLPDDYKQFLIASDGIEFMPSIYEPGFRAVDELRWQSAAELGLDDFRIDLGCKVDAETYQTLPKMSKVLLVSEEESEELVWYIHPRDVAKAMEALKQAGKSPEEVGEHGWRAVFWVHWMSDLKWLKSFRGYMESLAYKAYRAGAQLETDGSRPKSLKLII